ETRYSNFRQLKLSNGLNDALKVSTTSVENVFHSVLISGFDRDGLNLDGSSGKNTYKDFTIMNIGRWGMHVDGADEGLFVNFIIGNTVDSAIYYDFANDTRISNLELLNIGNASHAITISGNDSGQAFHGNFNFDQAYGCSDSNGLRADCQAQGASDHTIDSTSQSASSSFVGALSVDDPINPLTPVSEQYDADTIDRSEWQTFENGLRLFNTDEFLTGVAAAGACAPGENCRIVDYNLRFNDTVYRKRYESNAIQDQISGGATNCPLSRYSSDFSAGFGRRPQDRLDKDSSFLTRLEEAIGDGVGDEDGLCEEDEWCNDRLNFGFDQDRENWTYSDSCNEDWVSGSGQFRAFGHRIEFDDRIDDSFDLNGSEARWRKDHEATDTISGASFAGNFASSTDKKSIVMNKSRVSGRHYFEVRLQSGAFANFFDMKYGFARRDNVSELSGKSESLRDGNVSLNLSNGSVNVNIVQSSVTATSGWATLSGQTDVRLGVAIDYSTGDVWLRDRTGAWINSAAPNGASLATATGLVNNPGWVFFMESGLVSPTKTLTVDVIKDPSLFVHGLPAGFTPGP
ncbi:MAG: hypothetical protein HRT45_19650, partial [Bdellovibrionales bacterium]|nr:hypothetical protein [Bdellovibrionales bacterium]